MSEKKPYITDKGEVRELDDAFFDNGIRGWPLSSEKIPVRTVPLGNQVKVSLQACDKAGEVQERALKLFRDVFGL